MTEGLLPRDDWAPGVCIYCGERRKLTKEHVFPDWIRNILPRKSGRHTLRFVDKASARAEDIQTLKKIDGDPGSLRIRRVCGVCNGGWMSTLQQKAKPIITALVMGEGDTLTSAQQRIIAGFVAMTVVINDYKHPEYVAISAIERQILRATGTPPRSWWIWLGRYAGGGDFTSYRATYSWPLSSQARICNSQVTTYTIGKTVFQAMSFGHPRAEDPPFVEAMYAMTNNLVQIWPPKEEDVRLPEHILAQEVNMTAYAISFALLRLAGDTRREWKVPQLW